MQTFSRRAFVTTGAAAAIAVPALSTRATAAAMIERIDGGLPESFPTQDADQVQAVVLKPILLGINKPVHILQMGSSINDIVNMTAIAVVDAQIKLDRES